MIVCKHCLHPIVLNVLAYIMNIAYYSSLYWLGTIEYIKQYIILYNCMLDKHADTTRVY